MSNRRASFLFAIVIFLILSTQFEVHADSGDIVRTVTFKTAFGTSTHIETVTIPKQTLSYWKSASHPEPILQYTDNNYAMDFSHYVDAGSVANISASVAAAAKLGEEDVADTVLSFVQNLGYVVDDYTAHNTLYPVETLAQGGVCDDLSVLYASMMIAIGFNVVFIWYPKETDLGGSKVTHLNVGVRLSNPPQHTTDQQYAFFTVKGVDNYAAETTREGWKVGDLPEPLRGQDTYVEQAPAPTSNLEINAAATVTRTVTLTVTSTTMPSSVPQLDWTNPLLVTGVPLFILVVISSFAAYRIGKGKSARREEYPARIANEPSRSCTNCGSTIPFSAKYCPNCGRADYSAAYRSASDL